MSEEIKKKLLRELKFNSFIIKSEYVALIVNTLENHGFDLSNKITYESCVKQLCDSLEKEVEFEKSIERSQVDRAIEACLRSGFDDSETILNVIDAFNFPKLHYNLERKLYMIDKKKNSKLLSEPESRAELFLNRYRAIKNRVQKCFKHKNMFVGERDKTTLQTIDFLLTISHKELRKNLILGALLQGSNGKYFLEDPTGIIELDLEHVECNSYKICNYQTGLTCSMRIQIQSVERNQHISADKFHQGFYCEGCFVLVSGLYEDKILQVSSMFLPPGEEYKDSKIIFGNLNYFGGKSETPMRQSDKLQQIMMQHDTAMLVFISDLWLDKHIVFEKLELMFQGYSEEPPIAFVFMGNFLSTSYGYETIPMLKKLFKQLAELIQKYDNVAKISQFIFVPGINDPCIPCLVPKPALPKIITNEFKKLIPRSWFTSNPCRIQYCTREIVVYKTELISKFVQESLHKPSKEKVTEFVTRTIVSQGHLCPFSLNVQPVHWNLDYTLQLYPLPNLVVIGDKSNAYNGSNKDCKIVNPGCFIESGFSFLCYIPATDNIEECML